MVLVGRALLKTAGLPRYTSYGGFYNSQYLPAVGRDFAASEFAQSLRDAHVHSIVLVDKRFDGRAERGDRARPQE